MKSSSVVRPLRMPSTQQASAATWISSAFISSPVARITPSTIGQTASSSPMPLQRFWNAWLCVLIRTGHGEPAARVDLPGRPGARARGRRGPIREIVPAGHLDRGAGDDPVLLAVRAAEDRRRVGHDEVDTRRLAAAHRCPGVAHEPVPSRLPPLPERSQSAAHSACRVSCQRPTTRSATSPTSVNARMPSSDEAMIAPNSCSERELGAVVVDQAPDARVALAEEEVADDRADHREAGRDLQPDEDRGQGGRELELRAGASTGSRACSEKRSCSP